MKIQKKILALIIVSMFLFFFVFNDLGLFKLHQLNKTRSKLKKNIDSLIMHELKLQDEIEKLNDNDEYLQLVARERFHLVKPGEKIYKVVDRKTIGD